ncbi:MAG: hypothetical protein JWN04_5666 [Myxococcaceae bacterium]|nr:hypothetical protein [Myxococcaceae bacterium]
MVRVACAALRDSRPMSSMRWFACLLLAGCLAKSQQVNLPDGQSAMRIECNYTVDNCRAEARKLCGRGFSEVGSGNRSCKDCGAHQTTQDKMLVPSNEQEPSSVFKGVLYVRCN